LHGNPQRIGLALGSGSARGWAHIGVIRALRQAGIEPDIVCGTSIGAVVGAAYAAGKLETYEKWVRKLDRRKVVGYFDLSLRGGLIKARRVFEFLHAEILDRPIESLERPFAAVATDLRSGQEVWLRQGSLFDSLRASVALPGLVAPVKLEGRWLVDGGLVNPVPVSLCRTLGADVVIAVDLNTVLVSRRFRGQGKHPAAPSASLGSDTAEAEEEKPEKSLQGTILSLTTELRQLLRREETESEEQPPSIYEVLASCIDIMAVRITRSRMAGDPPELLITPRLEDFGLLDFDRAAEAIDEGKRAVSRALAAAPPSWSE
jgi:NTE family protein